MLIIIRLLLIYNGNFKGKSQFDPRGQKLLKKLGFIKKKILLVLLGKDLGLELSFLEVLRVEILFLFLPEILVC